jgi:hypothetical protein
MQSFTKTNKSILANDVDMDEYDQENDQENFQDGGAKKSKKSKKSGSKSKKSSSKKSASKKSGSKKSGSKKSSSKMHRLIDTFDLDQAGGAKKKSGSKKSASKSKKSGSKKSASKSKKSGSKKSGSKKSASKQMGGAKKKSASKKSASKKSGSKKSASKKSGSKKSASKNSGSKLKRENAPKKGLNPGMQASQVSNKKISAIIGYNISPGLIKFISKMRIIAKKDVKDEKDYVEVNKKLLEVFNDYLAKNGKQKVIAEIEKLAEEIKHSRSKK